MDTTKILAQLAGSLQRRLLFVTIDDLRGASNGAAGPSDGDPHFAETTQAIASIRRLTTEGRRVPTTVTLRLGGGERSLVPLSTNGQLLGYLWIDTDRAPSLGHRDYGLINSAARLLGTADAAPSGGASKQDVVASLLDSRPKRREAALRHARQHRWFDPYGHITVRAVLHENPVDDLHRAAFGGHLATMTRTHSLVLGVVDGALLLATSTSRCETDVDELIRREASRRGIPVLSIGSASARPDTTDLLATATEARTAAELRASLGGAASAAALDENMGTWMLLHAVSGSRALIERASPAADELWRASDPLQRNTVEAYLDAGGQVAVACKRLHVHRTTLYYRLDNMPETVRDALADGMKRSTLHLALKLLRLWEGAGAHERSPGTQLASLG